MSAYTVDDIGLHNMQTDSEKIIEFIDWYAFPPGPPIGGEPSYNEFDINDPFGFRKKEEYMRDWVHSAPWEWLEILFDILIHPPEEYCFLVDPDEDFGDEDYSWKDQWVGAIYGILWEWRDKDSVQFDRNISTYRSNDEITQIYARLVKDKRRKRHE